MLFCYFQNTASDFLQIYNNTKNDRTSENLNQILKLCLRFIDHKNGVCIQNLTEIFEWLCVYLDHQPQLAHDHLHTLASVVSTISLFQIGLPSYQCYSLIEKV